MSQAKITPPGYYGDNTLFKNKFFIYVSLLRSCPPAILSFESFLKYSQTRMPMKAKTQTLSNVWIKEKRHSGRSSHRWDADERVSICIPQ
jgi:hypothetical protein